MLQVAPDVCGVPMHGACRSAMKRVPVALVRLGYGMHMICAVGAMVTIMSVVLQVQM
jgi:hypothetical protein